MEMERPVSEGGSEEAQMEESRGWDGVTSENRRTQTDSRNVFKVDCRGQRVAGVKRDRQVPDLSGGRGRAPRRGGRRVGSS